MDTIVFILALPGLWIFLQTLASFLFSCENFIDEWLLARLSKPKERENDEVTASEEEEADEVEPVGILVLISAFFGIIVSTVFGLVAYLVPDQSVTLDIGVELTLQGVLVGMLEIVWLIPYLHATNHASAVKAAPLFQVIPVISLILGFTFFNEKPPVVHIIAAAIIIAGGLLLNLSEVKGKWSVDRKTIGLMLAASVIIAFIAFIFKDTALEGNFVAAAFYSGIGMTTSGILIFILYAPYRKKFLAFCKEADKPAVLAQLANEVVDTAAVTTTHLAVVIGPSVMAVSALGAWQPVFILIIGWILAKRGSKLHAELLNPEKFKQNACAIALLAIGTVLIAL